MVDETIAFDLKVIREKAGKASGGVEKQMSVMKKILQGMDEHQYQI